MLGFGKHEITHCVSYRGRAQAISCERPLAWHWLDAPPKSDGEARPASQGSEARSTEGGAYVPVFTRGAQHSIRDIHSRSASICQGTEWVPPNRYLKPGNDSEVILANGLRQKTGSPRTGMSAG